MASGSDETTAPTLPVIVVPWAASKGWRSVSRTRSQTDAPKPGRAGELNETPPTVPSQHVGETLPFPRCSAANGIADRYE